VQLANTSFAPLSGNLRRRTVNLKVRTKYLFNAPGATPPERRLRQQGERKTPWLARIFRDDYRLRASH